MPTNKTTLNNPKFRNFLPFFIFKIINIFRSKRTNINKSNSLEAESKFFVVLRAKYLATTNGSFRCGPHAVDRLGNNAQWKALQYF